MDEEAEKIRFQKELEFLQCFSNPAYLHYLAQNRYFDDESFINYLQYLLYWKKPEYAKYLIYPHSLFFLDLLQNQNFRKQLGDANFCNFIHQQQFYHWKFYQTNRLKEQENAESPNPNS